MSDGKRVHTLAPELVEVLRPYVLATTRLIEQMTPLMQLTGFLPPPPKTESGMTARQYRAARRRWARNRKATS